MESCLYEGVVHHERLTPVRHRFDYRMYMVYLDLVELPALVRSGILSSAPFAPASFVRRDHLGDPARPLVTCLRTLILQDTGIEANGPIRVLTHLRCFGYYFNPLTMYYCFAQDGTTLQAVVAMVQNTPWLERHAYVLWHGIREPKTPEESGCYRHAKKLHVSPFMPMEVEYRWRLSPPGANLQIAIENAAENSVFFRAGLRLKRLPLTSARLQRMQIRYPLMTVRMTAAIYYQALKLWRKKCPSYSHPKHLTPMPSQSPPAKSANLDGSVVSAGAA